MRSVFHLRGLLVMILAMVARAYYRPTSLIRTSRHTLQSSRIRLLSARFQSPDLQLGAHAKSLDDKSEHLLNDYQSSIEHPVTISGTLLAHVRKTIAVTLTEKKANDPETIPAVEDGVDTVQDAIHLYEKLLHIPGVLSSNKVISDTGEKLCRAIAVLPMETVRGLIEGTEDVVDVLSKYDRHLDASRAMFDTIQKHHRAISEDAWPSVVTSTAALQGYSAAATSMGAKKWVVEGNLWMESFASSFFRLGGARRHFLTKHYGIRNVTFGTADEKKAFVETYQKDLMVDTVTGVQQKIRLLDVGSCYNPIARSDQAGVFDVMALDLYPTDTSVLQCDFLALKVGEPNSLPELIPQHGEEAGSGEAASERGAQLVQLPAGAFDAVTMSLVLSYLPSPEQRVAMIRKARQLLISPESASTQPHRAGLLLITEKESIFSRHHTLDTVGKNKSFLLSSWKQAIANEGFELVKYRVLRSGNHISHAFAFATIPVGSSVSQDPTLPDAKMWIKQDFDPVQEGSDEDSATVREEDGEGKAAEGIRRGRTLVEAWGKPVGIVGGGIGGSALALSLQRKKIPFLMFEKDAGLHVRKQGYALTMQQGGPALRALGLGDALSQHGTVSTSHASYRSTGAALGTYGLTKRKPASASRSDVTDDLGLLKAKTRHNVHIPRQRLREIMLQEIAPENVLWDKKLAAVEVVPAQFPGAAEECAYTTHLVRARFEDGSVHELSALVGADGIYSTVRQQLHDLLASTDSPAQRRANQLEYFGLMVILGITPNARVPELNVRPGGARGQRQWLDGETRVFSMPYDQDHTMWQMSFACPEKFALSLAEGAQAAQTQGATPKNPLLEEALQRCDGWAPELVDLLRASDPQLVSGHPLYDRIPDYLDPLLRGSHEARDGVEVPLDDGSSVVARDLPITLLGDAAHPMSPFKGQGANQAILDALALFRAISSSALCGPAALTAQAPGRGRARCSLAENLRQYEAEMYAKGAEKVQQSRRAAYVLHNDCALAEANVTRAKAAEDLAASLDTEVNSLKQ